LHWTPAPASPRGISIHYYPDRPYTITGAPRIVKDKVVIGNGGAEYGVRGYVTAYNTETGAEEWRFYTVPGNPADGFESDAMREAAKTWIGGKWWEVGGGGTGLGLYGL
jgi:quinohemoprotein ethanol dehydrogenase